MFNKCLLRPKMCFGSLHLVRLSLTSLLYDSKHTNIPKSVLAASLRLRKTAKWICPPSRSALWPGCRGAGAPNPLKDVLCAPAPPLVLFSLNELTEPVLPANAESPERRSSSAARPSQFVPLERAQTWVHIDSCVNASAPVVEEHSSHALVLGPEKIIPSSQRELHRFTPTVFLSLR